MIALKIEIDVILICWQGSNAAITTNVLTTTLTILRECIILFLTAASKSTPSSKGLAFHLISSVLTVTVFR